MNAALALFFGTSALVGLAGLLALTPRRGVRRLEPYALPAARTVAFITIAAAVTAAIFH